MSQHGVLTVSRQRQVKKKDDKNEDTPTANQCCIHTPPGNLQLIEKFDLQNCSTESSTPRIDGHNIGLPALSRPSTADTCFRHDSGVEPLGADIRTIVTSWQRRALSGLYTQEIALHVPESLQTLAAMASQNCKTVNRQQDQTWSFCRGTIADAPPIVVEKNNVEMNVANVHCAVNSCEMNDKQERV